MTKELLEDEDLVGSAGATAADMVWIEAEDMQGEEFGVRGRVLGKRRFRPKADDDGSKEGVQIRGCARRDGREVWYGTGMALPSTNVTFERLPVSGDGHAPTQRRKPRPKRNESLTRAFPLSLTSQSKVPFRVRQRPI